MPDFEVTSPEGKKFVVTAPEGASQDQVLEYAKKNFTSKQLEWPAPPPARPLYQEALPTVGSVAGGIIGFGAGGMPGSAAGTALGTSIGTSARDIMRESRGDPGAPQGASQALQNQVGEVLPQIAADLAGNVVLKGAGRVIAPVIGRVLGIRPGAKEAQDLLQNGGGTLSISQVTESPFMASMEDVARVGWFGKGEFVKLGEQNQKVLSDTRQAMVKDLTSIPTDKIARRGGMSFQDAVQSGDEAHKLAASKLYQEFGAKVGNVTVDISPVKAATDSILQSYQRIGAKPTGKLAEVINLVQNSPKDVAFADAHFLRSQLDSIKRDLSASTDPDSRALAMAKTLVGETSKSMEEGAKKLSPDLYKEYRAVSDFYRKGKEAFHNDILVDLMRKNPERVGETLFRTGNESEVIQARATLRQAARMDKTIDEQKVWKNMQAGWMEAELTKKSTQTAEGDVVGRNLMKDLSEGKMSRTFNATFTASQRTSIRNFARASFLSEDEPKIKGLGVLVPMIQAGAVAGILYGGYRGDRGEQLGVEGLTAGAILLSPKMLAKAMTNPRLINMITQGIYTPASSKVAIPLVKSIVELMKKEEPPVAQNGKETLGNINSALPTTPAQPSQPQPETLGVARG